MEISRDDAVSNASATPAESAHPLLELRTQRLELLRVFDGLASTKSDIVGNALVEPLCATELAIVEADARTYIDALVQIEQLCQWQQEGVIKGGDEAMKRLVEVLPARIERLAAEA